MKNEEKILKSNLVQSKEFSYSIGNLTFKWSLRTDIKQELKDAIEISNRFISDAQEELKKL